MQQNEQQHQQLVPHEHKAHMSHAGTHRHQLMWQQGVDSA